MIIISSSSTPAEVRACSKSRQTEGSSALSINYLASVALYKQAPLVERRVPLHSQLLPNVPLIYYWERKSRTGCCVADPPWSPLWSALIRTPLTGVGCGVCNLLQCPCTPPWGRIGRQGCGCSMALTSTTSLCCIIRALVFYRIFQCFQFPEQYCRITGGEHEPNKYDSDYGLSCFGMICFLVL